MYLNIIRNFATRLIKKIETKSLVETKNTAPVIINKAAP